MANIMINDYCNLNCSYCFAKNIFSKERINISKDYFLEALNFIFRNNTEQLGIIGGEPTLHPEFETFMMIVKEDSRIKDVMIFTNGINIDEMEFLFSSPKFKILINLNNPLEIGSFYYYNILLNLEKLKHKYDITEKVAVGINIYENSFHDYWIEFMKKLQLKYIRLSLVVPMEPIESTPLRYHSMYFSVMQQYIDAALNNSFIPFFDCHATPPCLFSSKYKRELFENFKNKPTNILSGKAKCYPVVDILPNLDVIRCFGTSDVSKVKMTDFKHIHELREYYTKKIDNKILSMIFEPKCKTCKIKKEEKCSSGCYGMIIKRQNL